MLDKKRPLTLPGAVGFGAKAIGGRGGSIVHVTNTKAFGAGSLAVALAASGPRIIVFDVSGTITLTRPLRVTNPYFYIAGQTAPSPGIQITGFEMWVMTHDFIIQHITFSGSEGGTRDSLSMRSDRTHPVYNGMVDHCTMRWAGDECCDISTVDGTGPNYPHDITIQYCLIGENLGSGAALIAEHPYNITLYRNVYHASLARHPRCHSFSKVEMVNCISYNCGTADIEIGDQFATGPEPDEISAINGRFIVGPNTKLAAACINWQPGPWATGSKLYHSGNVQSGTARPFFTNASSYNPIVTSAPLSSDISDIMIPDATFESWLLARVGARPKNRDSAVAAAISGIAARTLANTNLAGFGGPVTYAKNMSVYSPPANPNGDDDADGWTNVEEDLFAKAAALIP
jgi:hypothetical protein